VSNVSASCTVSGRDFDVVSGKIRLATPATNPTDPNIINGRALPNSVLIFLP